MMSPLSARRRLRLMARTSRRLRAVRPVPGAPRPSQQPTSARSPWPRDEALRRTLSAAAPDLIELGFVLVLVVGVGAIFWPAGLILFGVLGVVACERRSALSARAARVQEQRASERVA